MRSELNYAGKNLSEFGMWFDNSKVYKKPAKRFMGYDIPARNGTLYQSENKFNNVIIEFDCFIKDNFDQNYHDLVNYLNSFETYQKLINSYNTDMFRMALFHEAVEVDTGQFLKDGRFKLFFDCKPQEYYADGAEFERIAPHSDIYTGNPAKLVNEGDSAVTNLKVALEPIQTGTGEPSPTNIRPITGHTSASVTRTGKNVLAPYVYTTTNSGVQFAYKANGNIVLNGTSTVATSVPTSGEVTVRTLLKAGTYTPSVYGDNVGIQVIAFNPVERISEGGTFTLAQDREVFARLSLSANKTYNNAVVHMQVEKGSVATTYEPYTGNTYTINLNGTRYGGTVDLVTGVLTVDRVSVDMGSLTWTYESATNCMITPALSGLKLPTSDNVAVDAITAVAKVIPASQRVQVSGVRAYVFTGNRQMMFRDTGYTDATAFKTAMNGNNIVYALETPQTVQLTAQQISLLTGINYISSSGEVTITTRTPLTLKNPSPMTAKPVFKFTNITAPFTVSANGETIISFQNAIRLVGGGIVNNMFFNATGTNLIMQKQGTPNYEETSFLINSGWLPAGRYYLATMPIGNLEVTSMDGRHLYSSGGTFTLTDMTQVKVWYVITPDASTPQNFNFPIYLRPLGTLYVDSELMDCYMLDGDTAYSFNECVNLPKDFLQLDERTVMTMTSGAVGFIAPNWWRL